MVLLRGALLSLWVDKPDKKSWTPFKKKYRLNHWGYDGQSLVRFDDTSKRVVVAKYKVHAVVRVAPQQLDVDVELPGERAKLSLKAHTATELDPWYNALAGPTPETPLQRLDALRSDLVGLGAQIDDVARVVEAGDTDARLEAKGRLAQVLGCLDKLQCSGIDAVVTSDIRDDNERQLTKTRRKDLNGAVEAMRARAAVLHTDLVTILGDSPRRQADVAPPAIDATDAATTDPEPTT